MSVYGTDSNAQVSLQYTELTLIETIQKKQAYKECSLLLHLHYIVEPFVIIFTSASTLMIDHKTTKLSHFCLQHFLAICGQIRKENVTYL